jgi:hypothetical protein
LLLDAGVLLFFFSTIYITYNILWRANGLLSVLNGLIMLKSLLPFRPLQGESRELDPTEDKNWLFSTAGKEDSGSAQRLGVQIGGSAWNV